MATFGASAYANEDAAITALINKSIEAGYTPDTDIRGSEVATAVLASMLNDRMVAPSGVTVGAGTFLTKLQIVSATLTPAAVAANTAVEQTFTAFTGVTTDDICVGVQKPTMQGGAIVGSVRIVAANNLAIQFANVTASAITPTAGEVYKAFVVRSS